MSICSAKQAVSPEVAMSPGGWSRNTFPARCMDAARPRSWPGRNRATPGSWKGKSRNWCRLWPPCHRSRLRPGRARVCQSRPSSNLPPMPSGGATRSSALRTCKSAVASPPALAPSGPGCAGRWRDSMRSYLCAPLSSMAPTMPSGTVALMRLSDCLQLFPTPPQAGRVDGPEHKMLLPGSRYSRTSAPRSMRGMGISSHTRQNLQ